MKTKKLLFLLATIGLISHSSLENINGYTHLETNNSVSLYNRQHDHGLTFLAVNKKDAYIGFVFAAKASKGSEQNLDDHAKIKSWSFDS